MTQNNKIEIPHGYKDSALGIIPQEWEVKRLGEVCSHFKSGVTITDKHIAKQGDFPVYGGNGLRGYTNTYTHEGSYVLIGRQGALCGNINYVEGKNYISEHAIAVQPLGDVHWLKYKLDYWNLNKFSESSAQPGLSVEKLIRYKLTVPPIAEQERIAEVLGEWDKAIELQAKLVERLQTRKRALMQQLLTPLHRLPNFTQPIKLVNLKGKIKELSLRNKYNDDITVLSVTNSKGFIAQSEQFDREVASADNSNYKIVKRGQFAYNPSRVNVGSLDLLRTFNVGILSPMYVVFKTENEVLDSEYLYYLLKSNWFIGHIPMYVQGSVRDSLSFDGLENMKFYIPTIDEQKAIAEVLSEADNEITIADRKLTALRTQKRALMQQLLTGKKRLKLQ